jgi:DHA3 family macrolide efflux protein-like MFS transporter
MLTRINAINGTIQSFVTLVSPMISGALLTIATIEIIFFVDVITASIAVLVLLLFLQVPSHTKASQKLNIGYFSDMTAGFSYINKHEYIKKLFMFCAFYFVMSSPVAFLTPLQVTRNFGGEVWRLTSIEVAFSVGMIVGGIFMAAWGGFKNKIHSLALSTLMVGSSTLVLGISPVFAIYLALMGLAGIAMPIFHTPFTVLLQEKIDEDYLGRVFGVLGMIASTMMPVGMIIFGPLADIIKIEWLLMVTGLLILIEGFLMLESKVLIEAGKPMSQTNNADDDVL